MIAGGWFLMGSEEGRDDERPVHRVWVDAFELAVHPVTNAEYAAFRPPPFCDDPRFNDPQQPVVAVSWFDAVSYCEWLSGVTGRPYRLPTEAEWEYAAEPPPSQIDDGTRWLHGPEPVARGAPNAYGLYDLCENVHEWCSDWYAADRYAVSPERNPRGPESGTRRASRGGSWRHQIKISRRSARSSIPPAYQYADYGFRVAAEIEN